MTDAIGLTGSDEPIADDDGLEVALPRGGPVGVGVLIVEEDSLLEAAGGLAGSLLEHPASSTIASNNVTVTILFMIGTLFLVKLPVRGLARSDGRLPSRGRVVRLR